MCPVKKSQISYGTNLKVPISVRMLFNEVCNVTIFLQLSALGGKVNIIQDSHRKGKTSSFQ